MNDINTISLQGWDQGDLEGAEAKQWVTFITVSSQTLKPVTGVNLEIDIPGKGNKKMKSTLQEVLRLVLESMCTTTAKLREFMLQHISSG